jgi:predicted anti-sigma-YlaC factor YlaD
MKCSTIRVALSAMLDGEEPGLPVETVAGHLHTCPGCQQWQQQAVEVTGQVRRAALAEAPDLTERVLQALHDQPRRARPSSWQLAARVALAAAALLQSVLALMEIVTDGAAVGVLHVDHEMSAFALALGIGLLLVAWRPRRAAALLPVAAVLTATLLATSAQDIVGGNVTLGHELGHHLLTVVQTLLLWAVARSSPDRPPASDARRLPMAA